MIDWRFGENEPGGLNLMPLLWTVLLIGLVGAGGSLGYLHAVGPTDFSREASLGGASIELRSPERPSDTAAGVDGSSNGHIDGQPGRWSERASASERGTLGVVSPDSPDETTTPATNGGSTSASASANQTTASDVGELPFAPPKQATDSEQPAASTNKPALESDESDSQPVDANDSATADEASGSEFFGIPVE